MEIELGVNVVARRKNRRRWKSFHSGKCGDVDPDGIYLVD